MRFKDLFNRIATYLLYRTSSRINPIGLRGFRIDVSSHVTQEHVAPNKPLDMFLPYPAKIKAIGLGGGGNNAITRMVREGVQGAEFIAINTDAKALALCEAPTKLQIGKKITKGLGVGGKPELGLKSAEESLKEIKNLVSGSDMVFIIAGMGGGTGTGTAPVVAREAKLAGALTIGIVTFPFSFEGTPRLEIAEQGVVNLAKNVDTLILILSDVIRLRYHEKISVEDTFKLLDGALKSGVQAFTEMLAAPGIINLDFADIKAIMKDSGLAYISSGTGKGKNRALAATLEALSSPPLGATIANAKAVFFNIIGDSSLSLLEVNDAAEAIKKAAHPRANIIFGVAHDPNLHNAVKITLIATGYYDISDFNETNIESEVARFIERPEIREVTDFLNRLREQ